MAGTCRRTCLGSCSFSKGTIRTLIEAVVVHGGDSRGGKHRRLELHGDLFRMLDFAQGAAAEA
ncbi:hypothetical protein, partial [Novosphingobium pentaromativorans]|uniref:hypothetical protein n=1 Tax=Novosphingobium pentaromativorans TaxID=205844 RepID=UPI0005872172